MSSPPKPPRLSRRRWSSAATMGLLGLATGSSLSQAAEPDSDTPIQPLRSKGNGPPILPNGLGTVVTQVQPAHAEQSFHFENTNVPKDPPELKDSVWVFARGVGVVMTQPNPNPPKSNPAHIWIYVLADPWPPNTTAYLIKPQQSITLNWPADNTVEFSIRAWKSGDK